MGLHHLAIFASPEQSLRDRMCEQTYERKQEELLDSVNDFADAVCTRIDDERCDEGGLNEILHLAFATSDLQEIGRALKWLVDRHADTVCTLYADKSVREWEHEQQEVRS